MPGRDFAADMVTTRGGINVYYEFKNWGSTQLSGTTFANQMTGTLSVVNNLNEIKYVFNPSRWVPTTSQMRNYLQSQRSVIETLPDSKKLQLFSTEDTDEIIDVLTSDRWFNVIFRNQ